MIEAVIFDLDGCLVDSEPLSLGCIAEEMKSLGVADANAQEIGERFLGVGMATIQKYVSARLGFECPDDFQVNVEARLLQAYKTKLKRIAGAKTMLEDLKSKNIGLGLATGGSLPRMHKTLEISNLAKFFTGMACSVDEVLAGKPAPDLFLLAAERLGVNPKNCMVLEDSPHGVKGAIAAGMRPVGFVGGSHLTDRQPEHTKILQNSGAVLVLETLENAADVFARGAISKEDKC